jgi:hypothetical protein
MRQQSTQLSWGFACKCSACRQPADHVSISDKRLELIRKIKDTLNDWTEGLPDRAKMAEVMVELYKQERLFVQISTGYESAAYAYSVLGDEYRTMKYASKAVEALTIMYGADHELTMDLYEMMLDPKAHRTWLYKIPKKNETVHMDELTEVDDKEAS